MMPSCECQRPLENGTDLSSNNELRLDPEGECTCLLRFLPSGRHTLSRLPFRCWSRHAFPGRVDKCPLAESTCAMPHPLPPREIDSNRVRPPPNALLVCAHSAAPLFCQSRGRQTEYRPSASAECYTALMEKEHRETPSLSRDYLLGFFFLRDRPNPSHRERLGR